MAIDKSSVENGGILRQEIWYELRRMFVYHLPHCRNNLKIINTSRTRNRKRNSEASKLKMQKHSAYILATP
jgi:hypothetical protein